MLKIHETAKPIMSDGKQVGWRVITENFAFDALLQDDKTINTYIDWGDDMGGDMANHATWEDVQQWLDTLL